MARMVVVYRTPKDVEAFNRHYFDVHIPLAKKLPGLKKYEISHGPVGVLAGSPDVYLIGTVHFDTLETMKAAFASPEGLACREKRRRSATARSSWSVTPLAG